MGIAFYCVEDNKWWDVNAADFDSVNPIYYEVVNDTTVAPNVWTYTLPAPLEGQLLDGNSYRIVSRAVDNAGNAEFGASTEIAGPTASST